MTSFGDATLEEQSKIVAFHNKYEEFCTTTPLRPCVFRSTFVIKFDVKKTKESILGIDLGGSEITMVMNAIRLLTGVDGNEIEVSSFTSSDDEHRYKLTLKCGKEDRYNIANRFAMALEVSGALKITFYEYY